MLWAFAKEIEPATKANKKKILNLMLLISILLLKMLYYVSNYFSPALLCEDD